MSIQFTNNASGSLAAGITTSSTTITLKSGEGALFPELTTPGTDYFYGTLVDASGNREIVAVVDRSGDTLTVGVPGSATPNAAGRGWEGTTARAFSADDQFRLGLTVQALADLYDESMVTSDDLIQGGTRELDGDKVDIDFTPVAYSPSTDPAEVDDVGQLSAHLAGIDDALAARASIDGDILDITFSPANYIPDDSPAEAKDVNDLAAHLNGIDTALTMAVPVGSVLTFAGSAAPTGFLECDGASLLRTEYPDLFNAIGTAFGAADATHFNLPDLRGQFVRGWDHGAGADPDAASRVESAAGGATGDAVGSKQADEFKSHHHTQKPAPSVAAGAYWTDGNGSNYGGAWYGLDPQGPTSNSGGNETRPTNVNLMYIIKATK